MDGFNWVDALTWIGAGTVFYWVIWFMRALVRWVQPPEETLATDAAPVASSTSAGAAPVAVAESAEPAVPGAPPPEHVAAISAVLAAILGEHRIVHISDGDANHSWAAEGRWIHQTSHSHVR